MKRYLLICLSALWVTTTVAYAEPLTMAGKNLRQAISGRTVFLATPVGAVPIRYRRNGTMLGSARGLIAQVTGSKSDKGRWWIIGNRLCQRWSRWMKGRSYCYTMRRLGRKTVRWNRNDGRSGTAKISK